MPVPEGEPPGNEMALGLTYLKAIEAAGGLPVVMPPLAADAIEPLLDRARRDLPLRRPRPRPRDLRRQARIPSSARPSQTSIASSWPSPRAPTPARCRSWRSAAAPRRSTSSAAAACTSTCPTSRPRSPTARAIARQPAQPPGRGRARLHSCRGDRRRPSVDLDRRQLLPPPGDRPARRGAAWSAPAPPTARSRRSRTRAGAS